MKYCRLIIEINKSCVISMFLTYYIIFSDLDRRVSELVVHGLAHNSRKTYSNASSKYINFCSMYGLDPTNISEYQVLRFITYLTSLSLSISTIRVYIAGVRAWAIANNLPVPDIYQPRVKWALKAVAKQGPPPSSVPPLGYSVLDSLLPRVPKTYDNLMLVAAMLLAYYGCFRSAEFCPNPSTAPPLTPNNITFHHAENHHYMKVNVRASKTSIHGFKAIIGCSGTFVCSLCWMRSYLAVRPFPKTDPLFINSRGIPLSHSIMTKSMRELMTITGLPPLEYTPHSLRAGSATDAAQRGLPDSAIQQLGRWRSDAFKVYLRPSSQSQAGLSSILAGLHLNAN